MKRVVPVVLALFALTASAALAHPSKAKPKKAVTFAVDALTADKNIEGAPAAPFYWCTNIADVPSDGRSCHDVHVNTASCSGQRWRGVMDGPIGERFAYLTCDLVGNDGHGYTVIYHATRGSSKVHWTEIYDPTGTLYNWDVYSIRKAY